MDYFQKLCSTLPHEDFIVPEFPPVRKIKTKRNVDDLKEPPETITVPTTTLKAVVDREAFHPLSEDGVMLAQKAADADTFNGVEIGREGVLHALHTAGLKTDFRHNARTYGHIEEPYAELSTRRKWRSAYGAIDRASKYTDGNRWGEVDTTCKKFKDLGRGVFYGVKDGSHHSDEFLDIIKCYDTATPPGPAGYYNYGSIFSWNDHDLEKDWVIYVDVAMGKLDGRGGGLTHDGKLDDVLSDMVLAGHTVQAKIHQDTRFKEGVGICEWWKHLDHNEEYIVVLCLHPGCPSHIDYDIQPANLERDRQIYERELESGKHGPFSVKFKKRKGRNVPVKETMPKKYSERLRVARGVREKQWQRLVCSDKLPPCPTVPMLTDVNWRIAMNKIPDGPLFRSFCSFVWDPRFTPRYDDAYGWVREKRNLDGVKTLAYPKPTLKSYMAWNYDDAGYLTEED